MATTVQQIIEAAYARSTANDPGKLAIDAELIGALNRIYQFAYTLDAVGSPEAHTNAVQLTLVGTPAVVTIPTDVIDIRRIEHLDGTKINLIPIEEKDRVTWHLAPAVYRGNNTICSRGLVGDPVNGDVVGFYHLDAPATLATLADALDARFPVRFHELLITALAAYLATKDSGRDAGDVAAAQSAYAAQMQGFLQLASLSTTALATPHGGSILQRMNALVTGGGG